MKNLFRLFALGCCTIVVITFIAATKGTIDNSEKAVQDSLEADRMKYVQLLRESIKGKENKRADSVFKNIKMLKVPAGRLLAIMNMGYSRSLGVSCGHCHNTKDFASEEKKEKEIARQMMAMARTINMDLLKKIEGLQSKEPVVNCTTCHRGQKKPALDLK